MSCSQHSQETSWKIEYDKLIDALECIRMECEEFCGLGDISEILKNVNGALYYAKLRQNARRGETR